MSERDSGHVDGDSTRLKAKGPTPSSRLGTKVAKGFTVVLTSTTTGHCKLLPAFSVSCMRIKILTTHPLPELKAWFTYDSREVISTVSDLKNAISSQFKLLRGYTLDFFLDDFEILDDSPIDVVRDGDLIWCVLTGVVLQCTRLTRKIVCGTRLPAINARIWKEVGARGLSRVADMD